MVVGGIEESRTQCSGVAESLGSMPADEMKRIGWEKKADRYTSGQLQDRAVQMRGQFGGDEPMWLRVGNVCCVWLMLDARCSDVPGPEVQSGGRRRLCARYCGSPLSSCSSRRFGAVRRRRAWTWAWLAVGVVARAWQHPRDRRVAPRDQLCGLGPPKRPGALGR
jgi:hypothetical protein